MARDTGDDWEEIGATEPWYGVLSAPEFLRANLTDATKEKFYEQGRQEIGTVVEVLRAHFGEFQPKICADFGSGLGRMSFPMSLICERVYGVDISPSMRAEAQRQAKSRGIRNVVFAATLPGDLKVDWINSYIVFQHILPRTGYGLIRTLLAALDSGGFISLHLTFAHDRQDSTMITRDLLSWRFDGETLTVIEDKERDRGQMAMYDYDLNTVMMILIKAGIEDTFLRATNHGGAYGAWIIGRRK